jgi:hypothetical protein
MADLQSFPPIQEDGARPDLIIRSLNWTKWIQTAGLSGDVIDANSVILVADPTDLVLENVDVSDDGKSVNFIVTGGTPGTDYTIGCTINTTVSGQTVTRHAIQTVSGVPL